MYKRHLTGKEGEDFVEKYLIKNNYIMIARNFSCYFGEIDIIAKDQEKNEIVFVEIKTRNNTVYGTPAESVTIRKRKNICNVAKYFIHIYQLEKEFIRFDVVEVYINDKKYDINHIKQAF